MHFIPILRHSPTLLLLLFLGLAGSAPALAQPPPEKIHAAVMEMKIVLADGNGGKPVPYADTDWKIVSAEDRLSALGSQEVLARGKTDAQGAITLSNAQREQLYTVWSNAPRHLWLVEGLHTFRFEPQWNGSKYEMAVVLQTQDDTDTVAADEPERKPAAKAAPKPLPKSFLIQPGFKPAQYRREFAGWQKRFAQDIAAFRAQMQKDYAYGKSLLEEENAAALKSSFSHSIHDGQAGLSLRKLIIEAAYSMDRRVAAPGATTTRLLLAQEARPVGYGGQYAHGGYQVELWYMSFADVSGWTDRDLEESVIFSAFAPLQLPPLNVIQRDTWPALAFIRAPSGEIKIYAMSIELKRMIDAVFNAQIR